MTLSIICTLLTNTPNNNVGRHACLLVLELGKFTRNGIHFSQARRQKGTMTFIHFLHKVLREVDVPPLILRKVRILIPVIARKIVIVLWCVLVSYGFA
jgi:hypothetical protein